MKQIDDWPIAFLSQNTDSYSSDKNRIIYVPRPMSMDVYEIFSSPDGQGQWDLSPSSLSFSSDGSLLIQVEEKGQRVLYRLNLDSCPSSTQLTPAALKKIESWPFRSIMHVTPAGSNTSKLLVTNSSFVHSETCSIVDLDALGGDPKAVFQSHPGAKFSLSETQVSAIWFTGANGVDIHAWVIKPSNFNPGQKYPLAYFIQTGPQNAWNNQWTSFWDLTLFAEQGYVVVAPNFTGSTGYGQHFTDSIQCSYGGLPYTDLEQGIKYIKQNLPYVSMNRAVALGTSYGGYMINWIQGQELGRQFKSLVTESGIFSITSQLASDKQHTLLHDLGGPIWANPAEWEKWDPSQARLLSNWKTPHLIIHSELDYQQPISDGLAAFNTLQMRGVDSQFLTFPDESRHVRKHENALLWYYTVIDWMDKHVMISSSSCP